MENKNCWLVRSTYTKPTETQKSILTCAFKPEYSLESMNSGEISDALIAEGLTGVNLSIASSIADFFVNGIQIDDILVVANKNTPELINLVRVIGDYDYDDKESIHTREVEFLHSIPRASLPKQFRDSVLRTPRLVAKITFDDVIKSLLDRSVLDKPTALTVKFPLRPDFSIDFFIPSDLTDRESERFSAFVKTLFQKED